MFSLAAIELPEINYRSYNGRKYSFVYAVSGGDFLLNASVCFSPGDKFFECTFCHANHIISYYNLPLI